MSPEPQTVTEIIGKIKGTLERSYASQLVKGEITNISRSGAGHIYFSLADEDSLLNCCLFKMDAMRNPCSPELKNGDMVVCRGGLGVYAKRGSFQLIVKNIRPEGKGNLKEQFEKLKKELASQGLFDIEHKQRIPEFPERIYVMTARGGAALQDFINIVDRRSLYHDIIVVPVLVQGENAPADMIRGLDLIEKYAFKNPSRSPSVVVMTRGGGSLEDLWAFNDAGLARRMFNFPFPIISAVGHQVDTSISDYVADQRCETPSAAAEFLTASQVGLTDKMYSTRARLSVLLRNLESNIRIRREEVSPHSILSILREKVAVISGRISDCRIDNRALDLIGHHELAMRLDDCSRRLGDSMSSGLRDLSNQLERSRELLNALGPEKVLERGYTYLTVEGKEVLDSRSKFDDLAFGKRINVRFHDGDGVVEKVEAI